MGHPGGSAWLERASFLPKGSALTDVNEEAVAPKVAASAFKEVISCVTCLTFVCISLCGLATKRQVCAKDSYDFTCRMSRRSTHGHMCTIRLRQLEG